MFVRYDIELPIESESVVAMLSHDPRAWLPGLARDAHRRGDTLLADVGFGDAFRVAREVRLQLGPPIRSSSKTVFPLRWEASEHPGLFPSLDADLEVSPHGPETRLGISARYVPPLRALGRALDRAILSRVAQATVRDFLDRVAESVLRAPTELAAADRRAREGAGS
jgi:hypothetical protein